MALGFPSLFLFLVCRILILFHFLNLRFLVLIEKKAMGVEQLSVFCMRRSVRSVLILHASLVT